MPMQLPGSGLVELFDDPPAHYAIETYHDKTTRDTDIGEKVIFLSRG